MEEEEIFFEGNLVSVPGDPKENSEDIHIQNSDLSNSYIPVLDFADLKYDDSSILSGFTDCNWKDASEVTTPSTGWSENATPESTMNLVDPALSENQTMRTNFHGNSSAASSNFRIDTQAIPCVPQDEQDEELLHLGVSVYDQTQFENEVIGQVDKVLKEQEEERRKLEVEKDLKAVSDDIRLVKQRLSHIDKVVSLTLKNEDRPSREVIRELNSMKKERENKSKHLKKLEAKCRALSACVTGDLNELQESLKDDSPESAKLDMDIRYHVEKAFSSKETEEEHMIRTGQMTPFGTSILGREQNAINSRKIKLPDDEFSGFGKFLLDQAESHQSKKSVKLHLQKNRISSIQSQPSTSKCSSEKPLLPSPVLKTHSIGPVPAAVPPLIPKLFKYKKKTEKVKLGSRHATGMKVKKNVGRTLVENYRSDSDISDIEIGDFDMKDDDDISGSDKEYVPDVDLSEDSDKDHYVPKSKKVKRSSENSEAVQWSDFKSPKKKCAENCDDGISHSGLKKVAALNRKRKVIDDGCQKSYVRRMKLLQKAELIKKHKKIMESNSSVDPDSDDESSVEFDGDFKVPSTVWNKLYRYQQTCVRWLWELHQQNCGGIMGDEMGLGKTIQVIAFLVGLKCSNVQTDGDNFQGLGPVILVCPATVLHQWVKEFHTWWPKFRVAILHESGSYSGPKEVLIRTINKSNGVLLTSYAGIVLHQEPLLDHDWHYVILDEGHKIRNPDAQATLVVKQFRTQHRIILSGSPVQNNLKELWSLFDFVFPGKLGTLPVFMQQFSVPIVQGGYSNASQVQVQTAYKCASVLRDTIKPYLLRRMKADVKMSINLPNKSEQVLFCQFTEEQKQLYKDYLASPQIANIINGRLQIFVGLINLRKICNHPDLYDGGPKIFKDMDINSLSEDMHYGYYKRSGKMMVVEALLHLWHKQGHRVLLFTQSRQMMEILEHFVKTRGYTYMKMDGTTTIRSRQPLISKFNSDPSIFVFLLTTRVGGLGVNLTGANRIIIYDPDWNPSTDAQARERAWRIGQEKQVTIYRLLTTGTIEEKIYHRQIFKQFVTNRVLKDPRQRRFFKSNDLYELFTFTEMGKEGTETSAIFAGTGSEVKPVKHRKMKCESPKKPKAKTTFTAEKLEKMKQLAKKLSLKLSSVVNTPEEPSEKGDLNVANVSESSAMSTPIKELSSAASGEPSKNLKEKMSFKNTKDSSSNDKKAESHGKRKRFSKSRVVDGEKIDYVVKKDVYKPAAEEEEANAQQDDYVLSKLFKKSGVHTALKHDKIVESSDPDYLLVEGEANRVAKEAVKALKASRKFCARAQEGIPTWTGLHGGATQGTKPRFGLKKKNMKDLCTTASPTSNEESNPGTSSALQSKPGIFGKKKTDGVSGSTALSSTDLLSAIKNRNKAFASSQDGDSSEEEGAVTGPSAQKPATDFDELLVELRNYIAFQASVDGQATTSEVLEAFKGKLPCHQAPVFKSLLSRICKFSRNSNGSGVWSLKGEFR